jgi:hypothetical protein
LFFSIDSLFYFQSQASTRNLGAALRDFLLLISLMEPGEALGTTVQVAVALAGFAGVVVVFRTESVHQWSAVDKFRLRLLLGNSVIPLTFCLFGLLLLVFSPPPTGIWRLGQRVCRPGALPLRLADGTLSAQHPAGSVPVRSYHEVDLLSAPRIGLGLQFPSAL